MDVVFNKTTEKILVERDYLCFAGKQGFCKHVAAIAYKLFEATMSPENELFEPDSCTQLRFLRHKNAHKHLAFLHERDVAKIEKDENLVKMFPKNLVKMSEHPPPPIQSLCLRDVPGDRYLSISYNMPGIASSCLSGLRSWSCLDDSEPI